MSSKIHHTDFYHSRYCKWQRYIGELDEDEIKNCAAENFNMNEAAYCCSHCNFITRNGREQNLESYLMC
ncbi:hypothetical protein QQG55_25125 [Brugia pahangi]